MGLWPAPHDLRPRTPVLEWRIALDSPWRNAYPGGRDERLILICDHGYSSILAAGNLMELGFYRAGDVIGGFDSWKDHDLPIAPLRHRLARVGGLPGTGPPGLDRPRVARVHHGLVVVPAASFRVAVVAPGRSDRSLG